MLLKLKLSMTVYKHMLLSSDNKCKKKKQPDSDLIKDNARLDVKNVVFIRHGESDWNDMFNRGYGPMFPVRVIFGLLREIFLLPTEDSTFVDSPLSSLGVQQANSLLGFLEKPPADTDPAAAEMAACIRGERGSSILVSSNLRRAIATGTVALWGRLQRTKESLHILSSLQEISRNPDTIALSKANGIPDLNRHRKDLGDNFDPESLYDASHNQGNKTTKSTGLLRMQAFAKWVFETPEDVVIATGHSLYFRNFFNTYLPQNVPDHPARKKKLTNCGVASFQLAKGICPQTGTTLFRIEPSSVLIVRGGYC
ncbi:hypothetical protein CYMTET_24659 [Cymbomonas tetramitiformis]|uniref:Uncharacterized protein n=1 Tax=Cymbomonas tetramitiformis TaxID=36881 RepID=A0AAE0FVY4_9CHLO|nr:hypothetical protein CYMTET_24659 [Cymbomonas tetramitiformis]